MKKVFLAVGTCVLAFAWAPYANACTGSDGDSAPTGVVVTNPVTGGVYNVDVSNGASAGASGSPGYIDAYVTPDGAQVDGRTSDGTLDGRATVTAAGPSICINGLP